jgi:O-antigen/teichoic acid export membrane protein
MAKQQIYSVSELNVRQKSETPGLSSQSEFIQDVSIFSSSLVLAGFCSLIRSFFLAKLLAPEGFGIWRLINIFLDYLRLASLGTQPGMNQKVPFLRGRGQSEKISSVLKTVFATTFFTSIVYGAATFAWSFKMIDPTTAGALALLSPVLVLVAWQNYSQELLISTGLYRLRSRIELIYGISTMIISIIFVVFWGIHGAIAGLALSTLLALFLAGHNLWEQLSLTIDWRAFRELVHIGLPMLANGMLILTMSNADRMLIAALLSTQTLGIYSISNAGLTILGLIPSAIGQMLVVKFSELNGENKSQPYMYEVLDRTTLTLGCLFAVLTSIMISLFPLLVVTLLPAYVEGIGAGKLLLAGTFFFAISLPITNWCVSTAHLFPVLFLRVVVLAIEFPALYLVIRFNGSLELIALCVVTGFVIYNVLMMLTCNGILGNSFGNGLLWVGKANLPFLLIIQALGLQYIFPIGGHEAGLRLLLKGFLGIGASLLCSLPFIYWANKRSNFLHLLWQLVLEKKVSKSAHRSTWLCAERKTG